MKLFNTNMPDRAGLLLGVCFAGLSISLTATFFLKFAPEKKFYLYRLQITCFFIVFTASLSRYLWLQLTASVSGSSLSGKIFRTFLAVILLLGSLSVGLGYRFASPEPYLFVKVAFLCLGFMIITSFNVFIFNALGTLVSHLNLPWKRLHTQNSKNKTFIIVLISILMCTSGFKVASSGRQYVNVSVDIPSLPLSMNGTRIVQLSDVHIGPTVGHSVIESIVDRVIDVHPDLVVITGDLIDTGVKEMVHAAAPLGRIKTKYGSFFVTGNHEYIAGNVNFWFDELQKLGIKPLHNQQVGITNRDSPSDMIYLAGVDDIQANPSLFPGHGMDLTKALKDRDPKYPTILLAHQPHAAKKALEVYDNIDLILSGHTHGGQFFPLHIPIYIWNPFFRGLYKMKDTQIYVSSGTVYWGVPLRIGSTPEISIITLIKR